jgi:hypothetical protein
MQTRIARHGDADSFLRRAHPWLLRTEIEHNLILGIAERSRASNEALYIATVEQDGAVVGCALRTPPRKLLLTRMPPGAVCALAVDVAACYDELPAVHGPPTAAREFAHHWCERHECTPRDGMAQRLYRLDEVRLPARMPPGELRQNRLRLHAARMARPRIRGCVRSSAQSACARQRRPLLLSLYRPREPDVECDLSAHRLCSRRRRSRHPFRSTRLTCPREAAGRVCHDCCG